MCGIKIMKFEMLLNKNDPLIFLLTLKLTELGCFELMICITLKNRSYLKS